MEETKSTMATDGDYRPCKMLVSSGEIGRSGSRGWRWERGKASPFGPPSLFLSDMRGGAWK